MLHLVPPTLAAAVAEPGEPVPRTFHWMWRGRALRTTLAVPRRFVELDDQMPRFDNFVQPAVFATTAAFQRALFAPAARAILASASLTSTGDAVSCLAAFVQTGIGYGRAGRSLQTPARTLWDRQGICEDKATVLAGLLFAIRIPTVYVIFPPAESAPGHAAVAVAAPQLRGDHVDVEGVRYYYCETTSARSIGDASGLDRSLLTFPIRPMARLTMAWTYQRRGEKWEVGVRVANLGSSVAREIRIQIGLDTCTEVRMLELGDLAPLTERRQTIRISAPEGRLRAACWGDETNLVRLNE